MPALAAIGIVTRDMKESVRFYRLLGIDVPDAAADHLDAPLPSGIRLMWDTLELIKQLDPDWVEPRGHRMGLAFECSSPGEVDATHARVIGAGFRLVDLFRAAPDRDRIVSRATPSRPGRSVLVAALAASRAPAPDRAPYPRTRGPRAKGGDRGGSRNRWCA